MSKTALISGICGQDGAYLALFLLQKGYTVYGGYHRPNYWRLERLGIREDVKLLPCELLEPSCYRRMLDSASPDEIYHLAAMSFVGTSFTNPVTVGEVNGISVGRFLSEIEPTTRFYQASTSEMFGNEPAPQSERTALKPRSPYGVAKLYAHELCRNYRERGYQVSTGILFNHESCLRGREFVTQKIATAFRERKPVKLGNLEARRDWGHAWDYVRAMWMMQQAEPDEYVIGTGETHSVADFIYHCCSVTGHSTPVSTDPEFFRPTEVDELRANAAKAKINLNWFPEISFDELVEEMIAGQPIVSAAA